jgi:glucokinase
MKYLLAGDIGGTKTFLRLVKPESPDRSEFEQRYKSLEYDSLVAIAQEFLAAAGERLATAIEIPCACLAIAGAVIDRASYLPNLDWQINAADIERELQIPQVELINDFVAIGYGISLLHPEDLHTLQTGQIDRTAPKAVIGAGTGLGQCFLVHDGTDYQVIATEGGHTDFASQSPQQFEFVRYLGQQLNLDRISNDRVISGQGIVAMYRYLRDTSNLSETPDLADVVKQWESETEKSVDPAAAISTAAIAKTDPLSQATMQMFLTAYGAEAGNFALKTLCYGGIYLAGGIAAKNLPLFADGTFMAAFSHKGRVSDLLAGIPVYIILNPQVGLIGAAAQAAKLGVRVKN